MRLKTRLPCHRWRTGFGSALWAVASPPKARSSMICRRQGRRAVAAAAKCPDAHGMRAGRRSRRTGPTSRSQRFDAFGRIDIVVNNAGVSHRNQPMLEVDEAEFDHVYAVNVKSIYLSAKHCVPVFRQQGAGCFVQIASTAGVRHGPVSPGTTVRRAR